MKGIIIQDYIKTPGVSPTLEEILIAFSLAAQRLRPLIQRHQGIKIEGMHNPSGEEQGSLDFEADQIFSQALSHLVREYASEEKPSVETFHPEKPFSVALDPIDGGGVEGANFALGPILGIYDGDVLEG